MISRDKIEELVNERIVERFPDVYVVDIQISSNNLIQVELDKKVGYVSIEECVGVSRNVEHNLDRDIEDFELQVSSAGLDQAFKHINQYYKNIGKIVDVLKTDSKTLIGKLAQVDKDKVKIEIENIVKLNKKKIKEVEVVEIPFNEIKTCKLIISFKSNKNE